MRKEIDKSFAFKFGTLIRERRESLGLTQADVSARADIGPNEISKLENFKYKKVNSEKTKDICAALYIPEEEWRALMPEEVPTTSEPELKLKVAKRPENRFSHSSSARLTAAVFLGVVVPLIMLVGYFEYVRRQSIREAEAFNEQLQQDLRPQPVLVPSADEINLRQSFAATLSPD